MVEDRNQVTVIPRTITKTSIRRRKFWIIIGGILSIIIIAVVIPTSISLTRKKDQTTISITSITTEIPMTKTFEPTSTRATLPLITSPAIAIEMSTTTTSIPTKNETLTITTVTMLVANSTEQIKWKQNATTVAGGNKDGNQLNQLSYAWSIAIDQHQTIYIADSANHRILQWKSGAKEGKIIAGGNGQGNRTNQLNNPTGVIIDSQNNNLIIADRDNKRMIRCSIHNTTECQILFSNITCWSVTMDKNGSIYVSDVQRNEVRRWKEGETEGTIVAGGNGDEDQLNQLNYPAYLFVDEDESIYVSDMKNHRVMKWKKDAKEGIIVAGGNYEGNRLDQLFFPYGVIVDHLDKIYVADSGNHRVMRWCEGCKEGEIVVGGNENGDQLNQLTLPSGLSFDVEGNLYVSDVGNDRIQKFEIDLK